MNIYFSKQQKLVLLIAMLLLISFVLFLQFVFLQPAKAELMAKQKTLQTEQRLAVVTAQKKTGQPKDEIADTHALQLKLPVKPLQAQFMLALQKVETQSNSEIKSMNFTNDKQAASMTNQSNPLAGMIQPPQNSNPGTSGSSQQSATTGKQPATVAIPNGLEKLTVQLTVQSPSYQDFEKFIENLEGLKRLVVVEAIQYAGPNETTAITRESRPFTSTLTVSAFYMANLPDLEKDLPKIDTPEPAGKNDPLNQFPTIVNR
ncbi:hypothetical protein ACQYAD_15775 [Neobacillus sp. SM06]|uniref:hypothetical protein n=1 Tax=Neobacillus sp. SM06 TaxID=3422492 RepID=UPI003D2E14F6